MIDPKIKCFLMIIWNELLNLHQILTFPKKARPIASDIASDTPATSPATSLTMSPATSLGMRSPGRPESDFLSHTHIIAPFGKNAP